jgi:phage terminase small subunit
MAGGDLTPKQQAFVLEYAKDRNATAAARRAGYSERTARQMGAENLSKPVIRRAVDEALAAATERAQLDAADVLREWAILGRSDIGDVLDFTGTEPRLRPACEIPEHARRAISGVKVRRYVEGKGEAARTVEVVEFKLWPKPDALEKLGRHLGLLKDRVEHSGPGGGPIPHEHRGIDLESYRQLPLAERVRILREEMALADRN